MNHCAGKAGSLRLHLWLSFCAFATGATSIRSSLRPPASEGPLTTTTRANPAARTLSHVLSAANAPARSQASSTPRPLRSSTGVSGSCHRSRVRGGHQWLPRRNDCCGFTTYREHLALATGASCLRRFLATPLHEMMFRKEVWATASGGREPFRGSAVNKMAEETSERWTPRPISRTGFQAVT